MRGKGGGEKERREKRVEEKKREKGKEERRGKGKKVGKKEGGYMYMYFMSPFLYH